MSEDVYAGMPHAPAPIEPRWRIPNRSMLVRGAALAAIAVAGGWLGIASARTNWFLAPLSVCLGAVSLLAAWAAAIHLTGGEKFDDHPFV